MVGRTSLNFKKVTVALYIRSNTTNLEEILCCAKNESRLLSRWTLSTLRLDFLTIFAVMIKLMLIPSAICTWNMKECGLLSLATVRNRQKYGSHTSMIFRSEKFVGRWHHTFAILRPLIVSVFWECGTKVWCHRPKKPPSGYHKKWPYCSFLFFIFFWKK